MSTKRTKNEILPNAGYSATPLIKKLGIKDGFRIRLISEPAYYTSITKDIKDVVIEKKDFRDLDFIHVFVTTQWQLLKVIDSLKTQIKQTGIIWVSWPKKASKVATDLSDMFIRSTGIEYGLVDIKVCAVDEIWSGLKFVIPVKDRK